MSLSSWHRAIVNIPLLRFTFCKRTSGASVEDGGHLEGSAPPKISSPSASSSFTVLSLMNALAVEV